ncbi:MAG: PspA/IM30 family protein [Deltaproteobacteria bacterium]|nr:PspA/IM30 family protein [Deltaproteobacteria bacterium]
MGILGRLGNLIKSNTNAALADAEDPRKQLDQAVTDMEQQRRKVASTQLEVATALKLAHKQLAAQQERSAQLEKAAVAAVGQGKEEVARAALTEKERVDALAGELARGVADQGRALSELGESIKEMDRGILAAKARRDELKQRLAKAEAARQRQEATAAGRPGKDHVGDTSAFDTFGRMEERIEHDEARAEAQRELAGGEGSLEDRLAAMKAKAGRG